MNLKRLLNLSFAALLLTAGVSAFAADGDATTTEPKVVTLANGAGTVSWSDFVKAVNDPTTVKGVVPDDDPARLALKAANDTVKMAKDTVTVKQGLVTAAQGVVTQKEQALQTYINTTVTPAKKAYDDAEADLAAWNAAMTEYNNTLTNLTAQAQEYSSQIDDAKDELAAAQKAYDAVSTTTTSTTTAFTPWLNTIYNVSEAFETAFDTKTDGDAKIYYRFTTEYDDMGDGDGDIITMYISFVEKPDNFEGPVSQSGFRALFAKANTETNTPKGPLNGKTVNVVFVYLGSDYDATVTTKSPLLKASTYNGTNNNIIAAAAQAVRSLTTNPNYYTTTVTTTTTYNDPGGKLKKAVDDAQAEVNRLRGLRQGVTDQMSTLRTTMNNTQKDIDDYTKVPANSAEGTLSEQARLKKAWDDAVAGQKPFEDAITTAEKGVTDAQAEVEKAQAAVTVAEGKVTKAEQDLAQAQAAADTKARENYNNITLTDNVTVTEPVTVKYTGTIWGEGKVITLSSGDYIFSQDFEGKLNNAAVNGNFARSTSGAKFDRVAYWPGSGTTGGRYYDESGTVTNNIQTLSELGFLARNYFGVDFTTGKLVAMTDASKVYSITLYDKVGQDPRQIYVTANTEKGSDDYTLFSEADRNGFKISTNFFAETATKDLENIPNMIFAGNCKKVIIEDRMNFYCPKDIYAEVVDYNREFTSANKGQNAVCLPFDLSFNLSDNISYLSTYSSEDNDRFWFNTIEKGEAIPANTPALLVASKDFSFTGDNALKGIYLKATPMQPKPQLVSNNSDVENDNSQSWGLFKKAGRDEIRGASAAASSSIYGLAAADGKFHPAGEGAVFPAFRMVIYSELTQSQSNAAPRRIGIRDKQGNDVTDEVAGIKNIENDNASALSIIGGQGEIIIKAEADYGDVAVYSLDGRAIAVVDVIEGTNTVNVQKGIYIVMGKKVMVK